MRRVFILLILFSISIFEIFTQSDSCNFTLKGTVLDVDTKKPVPFASVKVSSANKFTMTNEEGEFTLENLCAEENTLIISCFGYCDTLCHHHHHHGNAPHFYLTQKVQRLDEVVIEAEQLKNEGTESISQTVIKKKDFTSSPKQSLAAVVSNVEGVSFSSAGSNVQIPIIHGLYGNRILVLNNGLKHGFQNWSSDHAPEIDITSANSITVIKGASGVQFGPEALGGAIIVESNPLYLNEPLNVNLGTAYESNGRGYSTNFGLNQGFKTLSYFVNGNFAKIGDRHTPDYMLTNTGMEEKAISTGLRLHHKSLDAKLHYSYIDQNLAFLRASIASSANSFVNAINAERPNEDYIKPFSYEINEPNQLTTHQLAKAELSWRYNVHAKLTFKIGRQFNHRQEFDVRRNSEKPIIDLDLITTDYQLEWKHTDKYNLDGKIGIQYYEQENLNNPGTSTTAFIPNYITRRWSAFIIESKHIGKNIIEGGVRLDVEENYVAGRETSQELFLDDFSFNNMTASIGVVRNVSDKLTFRSNLASAWRTPNMAELYSYGQHGFKSSFGLLRYYYNTSGGLMADKVIEFEESKIKVEKGYKLINEIELNKRNNRQLLTAYINYIENFIYDRPYRVIGTIRGPMPVFIFDQADALFIGFDYSLNNTFSKTISGKLGLSYLFSRNVETNEALINQPPVQMNYSLKWQKKQFWKFDNTSFSIEPSYTFRQFQAPRTVTPNELIYRKVIIDEDSEIFDFADAPNAYFLLGVAWSFDWRSISGGIRVENVLNTAYRDYLNEMRYFADEIGRNVIFNLNYKFKSK